jgi:hypothetical protein
MRQLLVPVLLASAAFTAACSSTNTVFVVGADGGGGSDASTQEAGDELPVVEAGTDAGTDAPSGSSLNPYGVPYPTDHLGWNPRAGTKAGDRIGNHSFPGYPPGSSTLGTVSLADVYDPQGKTHDVVFVVAGGLWDVYTGETLKTIKASTKRIATFAVVGEGTSPGTPATLTDLAAFRTKYPWPTVALDSAFKVFGVAFDAAAVPLVMVLDARTMEIATSGVGGLTQVSQVDDAVTAVTSRPATTY